MQTTLPLDDLVGLLTDWHKSAALNAARYHEARQIYAAADSQIPKRIVPAELARHLQMDDPDGRALFIQIKAIPTELLDREEFKKWTPSVEYGVLWPATEWPKSTEYHLQKCAVIQARTMEQLARQYEADRLQRMATKILRRLPALRQTNLTDVLRSYKDNEETIKQIIGQFEKILNETLYEAP